MLQNCSGNVTEMLRNCSRKKSRKIPELFLKKSGFVPEMFRIGSGKNPDLFVIVSDEFPEKKRISSGKVPEMVRICSDNFPEKSLKKSGFVPEEIQHHLINREKLLTAPGGKFSGKNSGNVQEMPRKFDEMFINMSFNVPGHGTFSLKKCNVRNVSRKDSEKNRNSPKIPRNTPEKFPKNC